MDLATQRMRKSLIFKTARAGVLEALNKADYTPIALIRDSSVYTRLGETANGCLTPTLRPLSMYVALPEKCHSEESASVKIQESKIV